MKSSRYSIFATSIRSGAIMILAAIAPASFAQNAGSAGLTKSDPILTMQEFEVQGTTRSGYSVTNSMSASRINMELRDTPINIQVLTSEFMMDVSAFGQREAVSWLASVDNKSVRGFNTREFLRNGILRFSDFSPYNIDRIEVIKGPSAVLDGITSPGGVMNVITKKPIPGREFFDVGTVFGSRNQTNAFIDWNTSIGADAPWGGKYAAFRLPVSYEYQDGITRKFNSSSKKELTVLSPSLVLRPFENTTVELELEIFYLGDDWGRSAQPHGRNLNIGGVPLAELYGVSPNMNWQGPDSSYWEELKNWFVSIEQRISPNLVINVSYNDETRDTFWDTQVNASAAIVDGVPTIRRTFIKEDRLIDIESMRLNAAYAFEIGKSRHRISLGWQNQSERQFVPSVKAVIPGGTADFVEFIPIADRNPTLRLPSPTLYQFITRQVQVSEVENSSYFFTHHGKFLDDRLITLAGVYFANLETFGVRTDIPNSERRFKGDRALPQIGAVYNLNDRVGVYVNTSQSMIPNTGARDGFGNTFDPTLGKSVEIGSKFSIAERLSGAVSVYKIRETGRIVFDPLAPNNLGPNGTDSGIGASVATGEVSSTGVDVDVQYNPSANWSVVGSYAWTNAEIDADTNPANIGRQVNGSFHHKVTLWNKYTFSEGPWDGFYVGGGFKWRGEKLRTYISGAPAFEKPVFTLDALVGYKWKTSNAEWRISLNVKNLLQDEVVSGFRPGTTEGFYFKQPTEYALTFGARF